MKIEVRGPTFSRSDALRAHAERRFGAALGRFQTHVVRTTVRLTDVNGPRGGVDQRCRVSLTVRRGVGSRAIELDERSDDAYAALDRAADRVGEALSRAVDRGRRGRRAAVPPSQ